MDTKVGLRMAQPHLIVFASIFKEEAGKWRTYTFGIHDHEVSDLLCFASSTESGPRY